MIPSKQMREFGMVVDDAPKKLSGGKSPYGIQIKYYKLTILYKMRGTMSYAPICIPMEEDMEY